MHSLDYLILADSSLEILPEEFSKYPEARRLAERFGVPPSSQILDANFHSKIVGFLKEKQEKRGRPDVVHFALLDATSTPLFSSANLQIYIHTWQNYVIHVKNDTRLPRTLQRFCGVMAKLLSNKIGTVESRLFSVQKDLSVKDLVSSLELSRVTTFSKMGIQKSLENLVSECTKQNERNGWIVGAFPHGHFGQEVTALSDTTTSISKHSLPAHVVTARLCYELEKSFPDLV